MSYTITKIGDKYNYPVKEFFCDTDEDVASLPTSKSAGNDKCLAGSVAKVANGNEYRLNNQDQWVKKVVSSAGGGGTVSAKVEQTEDGAIITIEDSSGETTASIENGKNGADGKNGKDGSKGAGFYYSSVDPDGSHQIELSAVVPSGVTVDDHIITLSGNLYEVTGISDKVTVGDTPLTSLRGLNGTDGEDGYPGTPGSNGSSIQSITLTKSADGQITGGKAVLTDLSEVQIIVTEEEAS